MRPGASGAEPRRKKSIRSRESEGPGRESGGSDGFVWSGVRAGDLEDGAQRP